MASQHAGEHRPHGSRAGAYGGASAGGADADESFMTTPPEINTLEQTAGQVAEDIFHDFYRQSAGLLIITEDELARSIQTALEALHAQWQAKYAQTMETWAAENSRRESVAALYRDDVTELLNRVQDDFRNRGILGVVEVMDSIQRQALKLMDEGLRERTGNGIE